MDITFQVPVQYCSLQHRTLLPSPITSTTGSCFCFDSVSSFFLELFLHWSPGAYWAPTDLGSSSFSVLSFLPFHTVHGVLEARILKWFALPFSSGPHSVRILHHDLSSGCPYTAWLTVSLSSTRLWSLWSDRVVFCDFGFQSVCPLMEKDKRLMEASWWERLPGDGVGGGVVDWVLFWWVGPCSVNLESNFLLMGGAVFPFCCFTWGQTLGEVMKVMATSFKSPRHALPHSVPPTLQQATADHTSAGDPWTLTASLGQPPVGSPLVSPGSWCTRFCVSRQESVPQSCVSSGSSMVGLMASSSKRAYATPRPAAPRAPAPAAGHCWPGPPQEILRHGSGSASAASGLWCAQGEHNKI